MAVIGEFVTNGNNSIIGNVRTLTVSMRARLNPIERVSRDAPDFRIGTSATRPSLSPRNGATAKRSVGNDADTPYVAHRPAA
ncbi:DUF736 family protein [Agrobacterium vitis]|uniref:DUF736 family protein n=1 Tax=Agrobacterium vitis TaxID=373 RepID=UPI0012E8DA97|nr:DUF736 family protein [Agrobacterium vitis]MUZ65072.1 DUF736 family protein [Agrobacterium vitis]